MTSSPAPSLISTLRSLTPQRPLRTVEIKRIAELQAARLLRDAGLDGPAVDAFALGELLGVRTMSGTDLPTSGLATETNDGWAIVLAAGDPPTRRRFSLAHELKHIIDDPFIDWLYPGYGAFSTDLLAERAADQFAAALLMPKAWIKRDWGDRHQDLRRLAARYGVSMSAMNVRLGEFGLSKIDVGHGRQSSAYFTHHARRTSS